MVETFQSAREAVAQTPSLVIDIATVDRNIRRLAEYAASHRLQIRPHTKTHKSLSFAERQLAAGASGLTIAKVGEAETMSRVSSDLLIAYPAVDSVRAQRIAELAKRHTVRVAVDSSAGARSLATAAQAAGSTISVLVDIDVGFHRTGVQSALDSLLLAREVVSLNPALRLGGLFFYPGHVWSSGAQQATDLGKVEAIISEAIDCWRRDGLEARIVSGGSTPTAFQSHLVSSQTEIRPGTYIFNDMNTVQGGFCSLEDCAAGIVCTIVSTTVPGKAVIDAGTKTLTSDRNVTKPESGHGLVLEYPGARLVRLSEEHGEIDLAESPATPRIGDRVTIIPNHICPCINLQGVVWGQYSGGALEKINIDTRGLLT
ncbi:alanine racemase [Planctomicrobium sp. SH664]|uniref:alanine racemase n=1 Tax=Planctomicrobium sp. SH664 TaxID=3448125 RepID=UPI003F5B3254